MQLLDLPNRHRAIRTIQHALDQPTLRIPRAIRKLWHTKIYRPGIYLALL